MPKTIRRIPAGEQPGLALMAGHFVSAVGKSAMSGFKTASKEEVARRAAICATCEYWHNDARLGLGKCMHHKCGCTRLKWRLATESCPLGKWRRVDNSKD